MIMKINRDQFS